jgi:hypothetical protein
MQVRKDVTISGFNEWMQEMEKFPGEVLLNLIKFHSEKHEMLFKQAVLGQTQPRLTEESYQPAAMTPLLDAVGRAIRETDEQLENLPEDTEVILVVLTDGAENASTEFTLEGIKALIQEKQDAGWAITYLGVSEDAWQGAQNMGVSLGATMNLVGDPDTVSRGMQANAFAVNNYMGGGSSAGSIYRESGMTDDDGQLRDDVFVTDLVESDEDDGKSENNLSQD